VAGFLLSILSEFLASSERIMSTQSSLLCPIDFSAPSLGALHYALAIARRFDSTLTVLNVNEPVVAEVADARMGIGWSHAKTERELRAVVADAEDGFAPVEVSYDVRTGKPAPAICDLARSMDCQLIVMGTHGRSGVGKLLFGATAERVLRETAVPVLLTPSDPGALPFDDLARTLSPMLVPVDFSPATADQVKVAGRIADALHPRVIIGHVLEPIELPVPEEVDAAEVTSERHRRACRGLQAIAVGGAIRVAPEILISAGNPAEEIARWVREHHAGLLVMALHSDLQGGPRMGSVTFRAMSLSRVLTLALPPARPS
jgi:nucleotide-binding universal stress UspA family protein